MLYQLSHVRAQESIIRNGAGRASPIFNFFCATMSHTDRTDLNEGNP